MIEIRKTNLYSTCEKCDNVVVIEKKWFTCGVNDYGSFIVECDHCGEVFKIKVGRDVTASLIISGAKLIDIENDTRRREERMLYQSAYFR